MAEIQLVAADLRKSDWTSLRAVLADWAPALLPVLEQPPETWTKQDVADMGFAIGQALISDGLDSAGSVDGRGAALEALFSRLPQF
jgi:hypothetical protein